MEMFTICKMQRKCLLVLAACNARAQMKAMHGSVHKCQGVQEAIMLSHHNHLCSLSRRIHIVLVRYRVLVASSTHWHPCSSCGDMPFMHTERSFDKVNECEVVHHSYGHRPNGRGNRCRLWKRE